MKQPQNADIVRVLSETGIYLDMDGVAFKPRAYEKAAEAIASLGVSVADLYRVGGRKAIEEIPGVGASIADAIEEMLATGRVRHHENLAKKIPVRLGELLAIEGLGPKSIKKLYQTLRIRSVADLERAARAKKIRVIAGFGEKTEENILKGIGFVRASGGRLSLGRAMAFARSFEETLKTVRGVGRVVIAGSLRRRKETIGDIDLLVTATHPEAVMDAFVSLPGVERVLARGETKSSVHLVSGIDADLRVVLPESYGAALNYFTGSKDHNVALRKIAIAKGYKLNEYGLYRGNRLVYGKDEEGIYRALGLDYIEPEMREAIGEIGAAQRRALPSLIGYGDLRGDLQTQTDWTDGSDSIEAMARAAHARGLEYIAITDHTKRLAMTGGLDEKRLAKQGVEIDRINKKLAGKIEILKGTECDILKDGSLDLSDAALATLDIVGVSVHSYFNLSRTAQTARIIRAMEHPHVDIVFHPTGRIVGRRDAYDVDMDALISAAKRTGTVLEIDANERLDLKDEHIRKCVAAGVRMSIDSDAHSVDQFDCLEFGVAQARRGWAEKKDIINAYSVGQVKKKLK